MPERRPQSWGATKVLVLDLENTSWDGTLAERNVAFPENELSHIQPAPEHSDVAFPSRIA